MKRPWRGSRGPFEDWHCDVASVQAGIDGKRKDTDDRTYITINMRAQPVDNMGAGMTLGDYVAAIAAGQLPEPPKFALIDFHVAFIEHPIIGYYRAPQPATSGLDPAQYMLAFAMLCCADFTTVTMPGRNDSQLTLGFRRNKAIERNLLEFWNWRKADARQFILDLNGHDLIDDELMLAFMNELPYGVDERKPLSAQLRSEVIKKNSGRCVYCSKALTTSHGFPNSFHADHVLPVALGGTDDIANLVPACSSCNSKKNAKTVQQFSEAMRAAGIDLAAQGRRTVEEMMRLPNMNERQFADVVAYYTTHTAPAMWWNQ